MTENTEILYLFGFSPRNGKHLENLYPIIKTQAENGSKIGIILIHDGVIGASSKGKITETMLKLLELPLFLYAVIADLKARGISLDHIIEKIRLIEYSELVDLMDSTQKLISWM
ncbi:MAG: sulfurtransferase complex subunit TusB [Promethearchaeota archaeon]